MIRKRILSIVALAATLASPFASADAFPGTLIVGMEGGYAARSGTLNSDYRTTAASPGALLGVAGGVGQPVASVTPKISDTGTMLGILAGYEMQWRDYFAAMEGNVIFGRYENVKMHHFRNTGGQINFISEATYIQGTRYGISGRFGMKVPPFFKPYFRVGGEYSHHEVSINNLIVTANPPPFDHFSEKKGLWTWVLGAGVEIPLLSDTVGLRLEYNYLPGSHFSFEDNIDTLGASHNIKERTHRGKLAIVINLD